jgi:hypothetical protein
MIQNLCFSQVVGSPFAMVISMVLVILRMSVLSKGAMVYNKFYGSHEQFWGKRRELISEHQVTMKYAGIKSPPEGRWFHLTSKNSSHQTSFYFVSRELLYT